MPTELPLQIILNSSFSSIKIAFHFTLSHHINKCSAVVGFIDPTTTLIRVIIQVIIAYFSVIQFTALVMHSVDRLNLPRDIVVNKELLIALCIYIYIYLYVYCNLTTPYTKVSLSFSACARLYNILSEVILSSIGNIFFSD